MKIHKGIDDRKPNSYRSVVVSIRTVVWVLSIVHACCGKQDGVTMRMATGKGDACFKQRCRNFANTTF